MGKYIEAQYENTFYIFKKAICLYKNLKRSLEVLRAFKFGQKPIPGRRAIRQQEAHGPWRSA